METIAAKQRAWNMPIVVSTRYADRLASSWVSPAAIFHGWTGNCLACIKRGAAAWLDHLDRASHNAPQRLARCSFERVRGIWCSPQRLPRELPASLTRRMEREYELADAILVPSQVARRSFERAGYGERTVVVNAGVDHHFFAPPFKAAPRDIFRVCYAGRVELLKGLPYLLQAWNELALAQAELVLIGEVAPEMHRFIKQWALPNVRFPGLHAAV